jgi:hypothetical protein
LIIDGGSPSSRGKARLQGKSRRSFAFFSRVAGIRQRDNDFSFQTALEALKDAP